MLRMLHETTQACLNSSGRLDITFDMGAMHALYEGAKKGAGHYNFRLKDLIDLAGATVPSKKFCRWNADSGRRLAYDLGYCLAEQAKFLNAAYKKKNSSSLSKAWPDSKAIRAAVQKRFDGLGMTQGTVYCMVESEMFIQRICRSKKLHSSYKTYELLRKMRNVSRALGSKWLID